MTPLIEALTTFRSYKHVVSWDLKKAYNTIETGDPEKHMRRLVWRWGKKEDEWTTYGFTRMAFGDKPAACGLEVALAKVIAQGRSIDEAIASIMELGKYVDDASGGGENETVDKMVGKVTLQDGKPR